MAGKSFKGNLEVLNLSDIFQSLAMNRQSGTLIVQDGKREKKIFFAEGEITLLSSNRRMKLGEMLIAQGKISGEDLDLALKLQKQSRKRLGEILVEEGFCTEDDISQIVKQQIEEEIYDLFLWRKAEFEFIADHIPPEMAGDAPNLTRLNLNTNSLIMEALRRLDEWSLIQDHVPSVREVFVVADPAQVDASGVPDRLRHQISLIDGRTTVEGLAEKLMISDFELCQWLAELVKMGGIRPLDQEELVDRAEEAYNLNDFAGAAALYGRLAEYFPGEPKIMIPLADSLRRTGAERLALGIYEELARHLEKKGNDPDRLRQCYEAITQLDPTREDLVRKLEEIDLRLAQQGKRKLVPVLAVLLALLLAGVGVAGYVLSRPDPTEGIRAAEAKRLFDDGTRARAEGRYKEAFELFREVWNEYQDQPAYKKLQMPILVATEPPGFEVWVNDVFQGRTAHDGKQGADDRAHGDYVVCTYDPATAVRLEIRAPKKDGEDKGRVLEAETFADPKTYREVRVEIASSSTSNVIEPEAIFEAGVVHGRPLDAFLVPSRSGKLAAYRLEGGALMTLPPWHGLELGEKGDVFSPPALVGDRLLVGATHGGLVAVDLAADPSQGVLKDLYPARGSVVARPLVTPDAVLFGTLFGEVIAYPRQGGRPLWSQQLDGAVRHEGLFLPDRGLAVFACDDGRVHAFDVATGQVRWSHESQAALDGAPLWLPARGALLVPRQDGKVVLLDPRSGERQAVFYSEPREQRVRLLIGPDEATVFVATRDGHVRALNAAGQPAWKADFVRPSEKGAPRVAIMGSRLIVTMDAPRVYALEAATGRLVWQALLDPDVGRVISPISVIDDAFFLGTTNSYLHFFRPGEP